LAGPARLAPLPPPDLGLKQRLGGQEVTVLTKGLVPFEQFVLVHADHASLQVPDWSARKRRPGGTNARPDRTHAQNPVPPPDRERRGRTCQDQPPGERGRAPCGGYITA